MGYQQKNKKCLIYTTNLTYQDTKMNFNVILYTYFIFNDDVKKV